MDFWSKKWVLVNRNIFTAIPFISAGVGGDDLLIGIKSVDSLRILSSVSILIQGLIASFIFIRNSIVGQSWTCRNVVFFLVGAITGLLVGLTVYYPMAYEIDKKDTLQQNDTQHDTLVESSGEDLKLMNLISKRHVENESVTDQSEREIISKLWFLIPQLTLSLLVLTNTIYGLSLKLAHEKPVVDDPVEDEELETMDASS